MKLAELQQLLHYTMVTCGNVDIAVIKIGECNVTPSTTTISITTNGNIILEFYPKQGI